jgi:AraC-like DNA-binding protein
MMVGVMKLFIHFFDIFFDIGNFSFLLWNSLILIITGLVYYLGLKGLLLPRYSFSRDEPVLDKNQNSKLPDSKLVETADLLSQIMEHDKIYLKPKLTLQELSKALGTPERFLSQVINQHFKMSFRDFINGYRLEEAKSKLKDQNFSHMSILGIAQECGFNSEASFYRIFKNNIGLSPKEFIQQSE